MPVQSRPVPALAVPPSAVIPLGCSRGLHNRGQAGLLRYNPLSLFHSHPVPYIPHPCCCKLPHLWCQVGSPHYNPLMPSQSRPVPCLPCLCCCGPPHLSGQIGSPHYSLLSHPLGHPVFDGQHLD